MRLNSLMCMTYGGAQERVEIYLIGHPDLSLRSQIESRCLLTEQFATFDAGKARCFLASDREHLLAVIEASFGDFRDFNRVARNLFASRISSRRSRSFDIRACVIPACAVARIGPALPLAKVW